MFWTKMFSDFTFEKCFQNQFYVSSLSDLYLSFQVFTEIGEMNEKIQCSLCPKILTDERVALKHFDTHSEKENINLEIIGDQSENSQEQYICVF